MHLGKRRKSRLLCRRDSDLTTNTGVDPGQNEAGNRDEEEPFEAAKERIEAAEGKEFGQKPMGTACQTQQTCSTNLLCNSCSLQLWQCGTSFADGAQHPSQSHASLGAQFSFNFDFVDAHDHISSSICKGSLGMPSSYWSV
jgi:hypothetical protein